MSAAGPKVIGQPADTYRVPQARQAALRTRQSPGLLWLYPDQVSTGPWDRLLASACPASDSLDWWPDSWKTTPPPRASPASISGICREITPQVMPKFTEGC